MKYVELGLGNTWFLVWSVNEFGFRVKGELDVVSQREIACT